MLCKLEKVFWFVFAKEQISCLVIEQINFFKHQIVYFWWNFEILQIMGSCSKSCVRAQEDLRKIFPYYKLERATTLCVLGIKQEW